MIQVKCPIILDRPLGIEINMQVAMNTVVSMTYELRDSDGNILEKSDQPVSYLHGGYDNIFPRVEE